MIRTSLTTLALGAALLWTSPQVAADEAVDFEKQILPIWEAKCLECHRAPHPDPERPTRIKRPKGGLVMDTPEGLKAGGESGDVIVAGDPDASPMHGRTMLHEDDDDFMPPKGDGLTPEEKELVARWIKQGADYGDWKGLPPLGGE